MKRLKIIINYTIKYNSKLINPEEDLTAVCQFKGEYYYNDDVFEYLDLISDTKNFTAIGNIEKKYNKYENRTIILEVGFDESMFEDVTKKVKIVQFTGWTEEMIYGIWSEEFKNGKIFENDKIGLLETNAVFNYDLEKYEDFVKTLEQKIGREETAVEKEEAEKEKEEAAEKARQEDIIIKKNMEKEFYKSLEKSMLDDENWHRYMIDKKPLSQLSGKEYQERIREIDKFNEEFVENNKVVIDDVDEKGIWEETKEFFFIVAAVGFCFLGLQLVDWLYSFDNLFSGIVGTILALLMLVILFILLSEFKENEDTFDSSHSRPRKRKPIKRAIQNQVWNRDGGRCVRCGSNQKLEFDHIIPHSKGGADTYRNLQLLCETCNRSKGATI